MNQMIKVGRPRKRPEYDADDVMKDLTETILKIYKTLGSLKGTAEEIGLSTVKVRKILVSAGKFENETVTLVNNLYQNGKPKLTVSNRAAVYKILG